MRIIFLGTPDFAVPSLDILYQAGYEIAAVITSPDRRGGRGRKEIIESAVKKYALSKNLPVLQPTNLKSKAFNAELKALKADLQIVVAFRMLPVAVWDMPPLGTYNLHGSLLPQYRGAAPINWAIINGENKTGVTSFKLKHEIDTGSLLFQHDIPIYPFDTAGDLHDRMMWIAADTVLKSVEAIEAGTAELTPQNEDLVSHAPKLNALNTKINFSASPVTIYNMIRGLSPFPSAWFELEGKKTKVYESEYSLEEHQLDFGTLKSDKQSYLKIACNGGFISLKRLQLSGKKAMCIKDFLNGFSFATL